MEHRKYSYECNQPFRNEWSFSIKYHIRSWYAVKQINQTKPNSVPCYIDCTKICCFFDNVPVFKP